MYKGEAEATACRGFEILPRAAIPRRNLFLSGGVYGGGTPYVGAAGGLSRS